MTNGQQEGMTNALKIGLSAMREQREKLDRQIREVEQSLRAPAATVTHLTKTSSNGNGNGHTKLKVGRKKMRRGMSFKSIEAALMSSTHKKLYARGRVAAFLIDKDAYVSIRDVAQATGLIDNTVIYSVRNAPHGLFSIQRNGNELSVRLTNDGAETVKHVLNTIGEQSSVSMPA